jgi:dolichol-phosphate mannosyltransferase
VVAEGPSREGIAAHDQLLPLGPLNPTLTVVVPCHNEERNLARYDAELFAPLSALAERVEYIIVDDGSLDGTGGAAAALAAARDDARVISLTPNRGLGAALRTGFAAARGEWIATLDADLTFRPENLALMLAAARETGADLVSGSPFLREGDLEAVPLSRRLPSLMLNALYRGLFGLGLTAYTPILRLYRSRRLNELSLASEGFEINAEIAALAQLANWKTREIPAVLETRSRGISKLRRWRELSCHARLIARLLVAR